MLSSKDLTLFRAGNDGFYRTAHQRLTPWLIHQLHTRRWAIGWEDDVVQETWVRAFLGRDHFKNQCPFKYWVWKICHNLLIDCSRKQQRNTHTLVALYMQHTIESKVDEHQINDEGIDIHILLDGLPARQREIAMRRYMLRETTQEIADALAIAPSTVRATLSHVRVRMSRLKY